MKKGFCSVWFLFSFFFVEAEISNSDLEELVRNHNGKIEELTHRIEQIENNLGISHNDTVTQEQAVENIKGKSPEDIIKIAKDFIKHDRYQNARILLTEFIKNNQKSTYCGTMHFYIGKSFLEEKKYQDAAKAFMESFETNPKGKKTAKALYKLAECFMKLGKNDQMKTTLKKITTSFPGTKYAKKATAELNNLK